MTRSFIRRGTIDRASLPLDSFRQDKRTRKPSPAAPPPAVSQEFAGSSALRADARDELLWSQLQALIAVARLGSFTKAAQRLGLSKAAISQRVAAE